MPDPNLVPVHRAGVYVEEVDNEAVVYSRTGKRAIYLNETATIVWKLCNGERTVPEIAALLAREHPAAAVQGCRPDGRGTHDFAVVPLCREEKRRLNRPIVQSAGSFTEMTLG